MQVRLRPGTYIVAVSGGVDSVVLLHALQQQRICDINHKDTTFIVAHFDHGTRQESATDQKFVEELAKKYGLAFVTTQGNLGAGASEATARQARYAFLHTERHIAGAEAILTAHHADDVLETAIFNLVRGTGPRGLISLRSTATVIRPLLRISKVEIRRYATEHQLKWQEDATNADETYSRNYIRHRILSRFDTAARHQLRSHIDAAAGSLTQLDTELSAYLQMHTTAGRLQRYPFVLVPHAVAREIMAAWLRGHGFRQYDSRLLERLVHAAKTFRAGQCVSLGSDLMLKVQKDFLALNRHER